MSKFVNERRASLFFCIVIAVVIAIALIFGFAKASEGCGGMITARPPPFILDDPIDPPTFSEEDPVDLKMENAFSKKE